MLADIKNFECHDYVVKDDKIGYKEQDSVAFNVNYGYKTLFAYFHEHGRNKISLKSLNDNTYIIINCGHYSYAEIPLQFKMEMRPKQLHFPKPGIFGITGIGDALNVLNGFVYPADGNYNVPPLVQGHT